MRQDGDTVSPQSRKDGAGEQLTLAAAFEGTAVSRLTTVLLSEPSL
jgi:hypothetical protein